jgi:predicted CXXCH cytochrome family protein
VTRGNLGIAALIALALARPSPAGTSARPDSPHGRTDGCLACHEAGPNPDSSLTPPGPPKPSVPTCRGCHPDADMHPVGMPPKHVEIPRGFPLEAGLVTCATCHAEPACDAERSPLPPYHREGPYPTSSDLCFRCHDRESFTHERPHPKPGARATEPSSCAACHTGEPREGAAPADASLRVPEAHACLQCHDGAHRGAAEHLGVRPADSMRSLMPPSLPLGGDGAIRCFTCHDVHDSRDALLSVPNDKSALCTACHRTLP